MGKKYLPVILGKREYKLYTGDLAKIHKITSKISIRIPPYQFFGINRKETQRT
jgi:hypothetical protein